VWDCSLARCELAGDEACFSAPRQDAARCRPPGAFYRLVGRFILQVTRPGQHAAAPAADCRGAPPRRACAAALTTPSRHAPPPALAACCWPAPQPATAEAAAQAQACAAAAPFAPPDAFFRALTRLRPDDPSWTWNPWDSPPQSEADRASAVRLTCPDFEFAHPGTVAPPKLTRALPLVREKGPAPARASVAALEAWAGPDLARPAAAARSVFVAYNPAPHDKARMTPDMLKVWGFVEGVPSRQGQAGPHHAPGPTPAPVCRRCTPAQPPKRAAHRRHSISCPPRWPPRPPPARGATPFRIPRGGARSTTR
jgi:hypothetical protein